MFERRSGSSSEPDVTNAGKKTSPEVGFHHQVETLILFEHDDLTNTDSWHHATVGMGLVSIRNDYERPGGQIPRLAQTPARSGEDRVHETGNDGVFVDWLCILTTFCDVAHNRRS